ncbi:MAG TPA: DUF4386 family protein [Candidatus Dormibacteraeota bacterium]|nr:DUF4386 family protein [Candidatus Dormibacteraeota bacterium]
MMMKTTMKRTDEEIPSGDRALLRVSATLLFAGVAASFLIGIFHPSQQNPNDHQAVFAEYASSSLWKAVHLGQFVGMALVIAGLLALFFALDVPTRKRGWIARFAAVSAVTALALYGVLQAVDGVALKQAVDHWVNAPDAEKAARFASAELVRWLEWGVRSYQELTLGLSLILFGIAIFWMARIPRPIGLLLGFSGLAYVVHGILLGYEGFSATGAMPQLAAYLFVIAAAVWLLISAWRPSRPL